MHPVRAPSTVTPTKELFKPATPEMEDGEEGEVEEGETAAAKEGLAETVSIVVAEVSDESMRCEFICLCASHGSLRLIRLLQNSNCRFHFGSAPVAS